MNVRRMTLQFEVTVPAEVGESSVEIALNGALDEPPCEWGDWTVGAVRIVNVERVPPEQLAERAKIRNLPLTDARLNSIIAADDLYYRPYFASHDAAAMATELLTIRAVLRRLQTAARQ